MFGGSDVAVAGGVGPVDADSVSFVGAVSVELAVGFPAWAVVDDDPFPVLVGLVFEGGPGAGEYVWRGVVGAGDYRNHAASYIAVKRIWSLAAAPIDGVDPNTDEAPVRSE